MPPALLAHPVRVAHPVLLVPLGLPVLRAGRVELVQRVLPGLLVLWLR